MILEMATAVANLFTKGAEIAQPFIEESFAQDLDHEHVEKMEKWSNAQSIKDPIARADAEWPVLVRFVTDCGETGGGLGTNVSVPSDTLTTLLKIASLYSKEKKINNRLIYNLLHK